MPTAQKIKAVEDMREWMQNSAILISTDYSGLRVAEMTELRRALRERGVQYKIIKNTLAYLAADAAGKPAIKEIVQGQTGIAFNDGEPTEPAKALADYIRVNRSQLAIIGGVMDGKVLSPSEIETLASLPSRDELIARLLGQLQAPVAGLARVLNGPIGGLARVLQAHADNIASQ